MIRAKRNLGGLLVEVEADTLQELLEEVHYIDELNRAREGHRAMPFFREWDGLKFYGFRRVDGAEVLFGQHKSQASPARRLYAYSRTSEGYRGWQRYDRERGELVAADPIQDAAAEDDRGAGSAAAAPSRDVADAVPPEDVQALVDSTDLLKDGVGVLVRNRLVADVRAWLRSSEGAVLMRDVRIFREVSTQLAGILKNPRNRRKAGAVSPPKQRTIEELNRAYTELRMELFPRWSDEERRAFQAQATGKAGTAKWTAVDFEKAIAALQALAERHGGRPGSAGSNTPPY